MTAPAVLVTGGAGYVGAHACKALARAGYIPVTYDNLSTGHESFVRWGPLVKGDIRDYATLREAIIEHEVTSALHFAACAYVGKSVINPQKYYDNNVVGTLSLLRAMLDTDTAASSSRARAPFTASPRKCRSLRAVRSNRSTRTAQRSSDRARVDGLRPRLRHSICGA